MSITEKTLQHIAKLSQLDLCEAELKHLTADMEKIINFANSLNEIDTENILVEPNQLQNVLRQDSPKASCLREDILKNAPETDGTYFIVPNIID